jgi:hypothetical protein
LRDEIGRIDWTVLLPAIQSQPEAPPLERSTFMPIISLGEDNPEGRSISDLQ